MARRVRPRALLTIAVVALAPVLVCPTASVQPRSVRTALAVHWSSEDYPSNPVVDGAIRLFTSDTATPVITRGSPTSVSMVQARVGASQTAQAKPGGPKPLEGTYWKAVELAGMPVPSEDPTREAHLLFQAAGRVSGSDGCNRITGSYELKGDAITFGQMAGTQMACLNTAEIERPFREALKGATRLTVVGDRLGATGKRVAAFRAGAQSAPGLEGTSWRLVRFQSSDDSVLTPDDRAKYTIDLGAGGQLTARVDCNRGRGTWKSSGPNRFSLVRWH